MIGLVLKRAIPGQLVIQYTDMCNARCPQCGMRKTEKFSRSKLCPDDVKKIIDAAVLRGVKAISFTGGEPFLFFDEIVDLIKYAEKAGIKYIRTGTNGFIFTNHDRADFKDRITRIAEKLAATGLYTFWISIDSAVPEVHESMRGLPGVIAGIEKALPVFHDHGIYPSANLGINRNTGGRHNLAGKDSVGFHEYFKESFRRFFAFVINMGFTITNTCYPMSFHNGPNESSSVYKATSVNDVVSFSDDEKALLFKALFDVIPEFRPGVRIFSPRSSLLSLMRQYTSGQGYSYPCRGGSEFFFIDAGSGDTYPCGYRGEENLGKFWDLTPLSKDNGASCSRCDWECFRDPSELFGPARDLVSRPLNFAKRMIADNWYIKLWLQDLNYYRTCNFFNGRTPPDYRKLSRYAGD